MYYIRTCVGYCVFFIYHRTITSSSLELSPSNTPNSCPASPNLVHKPLKSAGSEINVWSRLATTANPTTDTRYTYARFTLCSGRYKLYTYFCVNPLCHHSGIRQRSMGKMNHCIPCKVSSHTDCTYIMWTDMTMCSSVWILGSKFNNFTRLTHSLANKFAGTSTYIDAWCL